MQTKILTFDDSMLILNTLRGAVAKVFSKTMLE